MSAVCWGIDPGARRWPRPNPRERAARRKPLPRVDFDAAAMTARFAETIAGLLLDDPAAYPNRPVEPRRE